MYISGVVAVLIILFAVLMMLGVVPFTPVVVGGMFLGIAVGMGGPLIDRRVA